MGGAFAKRAYRTPELEYWLYAWSPTACMACGIILICGFCCGVWCVGPCWQSADAEAMHAGADSAIVGATVVPL